MKQALKLQKERGAIFTLHEYLEELSSLQVPHVSLQRQGATGAADSAAAADLLRMRQTPAAVTPSPQLLPSQSSGQERQQQRQSGPPSQSTLNSADWQSSQSRSNAQGSSPPASVPGHGAGSPKKTFVGTYRTLKAARSFGKREDELLLPNDFPKGPCDRNPLAPEA